MGKKGRKESATTQAALAPEPAAPAADSDSGSDTAEIERRFLATLQRMTGMTEMTEDNVREAMAKLTPEQRAELLAEGQELKRDLMTKEEHASDRKMFFKEVNTYADKVDMPASKDNDFLAKKLSGFMATSNDEMPPQLLLEALASAPYLVKAALAEARAATTTEQQEGGATAPFAVPADLAEIETALSLLHAARWKSGEASARPPFVRRNLLLLSMHLHREQLRALTLAPSTLEASLEVVSKGLKLLDILLGCCLQTGWVKAVLSITSLQSLLRQGLWDHDDDECRDLMKAKLQAMALKHPKINIRAQATDVPAGQKVKMKVTVHRSHAHTQPEMEAIHSTAGADAAPQAAVEVTGGAEGDEDALEADPLAQADGKEGWWLFVESIRSLPNAQRQGLAPEDVVHNALVGRQMLSASLDQSTMSAELEFEAPATAGEYKVIVHVRSSSMVGVDAKRKVAFVVHASGKSRRAPASSVTSSGTSESGTTSEDTPGEEGMREMQEVIEEDENGEQQAHEAEEEGGAGAAPQSPSEQHVEEAVEAVKASPTSPPKRSWADEVEEEEEEQAGWVSVAR